jgi:hypothetical protein
LLDLHKSGIVHNDIKPHNVMVTYCDDKILQESDDQQSLSSDQNSAVEEDFSPSIESENSMLSSSTNSEKDWESADEDGSNTDATQEKLVITKSPTVSPLGSENAIESNQKLSGQCDTSIHSLYSPHSNEHDDITSIETESQKLSTYTDSPLTSFSSSYNDITSSTDTSYDSSQKSTGVVDNFRRLYSRIRLYNIITDSDINVSYNNLPENIRNNKKKSYNNAIAKIIDFTLATQVEDKPKFDTTIAYKSPEYLLGNIVTCKSDLWSLGCLFFYMLFKQHLFDPDTVSDLIRENCRYRCEAFLDNQEKMNEVRNHLVQIMMISGDIDVDSTNTCLTRETLFVNHNETKIKGIENIRPSTFWLELYNKLDMITTDLKEKEYCFKVLRGLLENNPHKRVSLNEILTW